MSRTDTTQDSSMEEILASIRRIISEDAGPAQFAPEPARKPAAASTAAPVARPIDFGALQTPAFPRQITPTVRPAAAIAPVAPRPVAVTSPVIDSAASDDDDILDLDASYAAITRRPSVEPAAPAPTLALVRDAIVAEPAKAAVETVAAPVEPAPLDELLQPDPDPIAEPLATVTEELPAAILEPPAPVSMPAYVAALDISEPLRAESVLPLPSPAAEVAHPVAAEPELPAVADAVALPADVLAALEPIVAPAVEVPTAELSPAAAMAEAVVQAAPEIAAPPVPVFAVAEAAPALAPIASPPLAAAQATARTMEDMVAEMLRPMLRDWLDNNMPRIIEKTIGKTTG